MSTHDVLIDAFRSVSDKNALAWSVLDTKSELFVTSAIAIAANRASNARLAFVEYPPRVDLVLKDQSGRVTQAYLAKAGYATDFQPGRISSEHPYLGAHLNADLEKLESLCSRLGESVTGAGIFYLYEVSEPSRQTKYGGSPKIDIENAIAALVRFVPRGELVAREALDCGIADGAAVRIHLCIFDPATEG